jgi:predicted peroxiredoxin
LLVASSDSTETIERIVGLSNASIIKGHDVKIFFNGKSVLLLRLDVGHMSLHRLVSKGLRMLACRTSALDYGLSSSHEMLDGVCMSSMSELVELLEDCDRALFIG